VRSEPAFQFANILFAGPCNRFCPWCIGKALPARVNVENLDVFPPRGLDALIGAVNEHRVREIVFTGTVSDPQLYRHEIALLDLLRERLHPDAQFSVHTNGVLALRKLDAFNHYDRACISLPSFEPATYEAMMGSPKVPDLAEILRRARIPVKVSAVLDAPNHREIDGFLRRCAGLGVRRAVVRRLFGTTERWPVLAGETPVGTFRGNPVYALSGMEVTVWDFDDARFASLNLFADGTLGTSYLLSETPELGLGRLAAP
jgi:MoaA/NifB/PqqE/SkfB family radical SAM enzyme